MVKVRVLALGLLTFLFILSAGPSWADSLVLTLGGDAADKANQELEIYEVRRKPDGTTEEVRVTDRDGGELKIDMNNPAGSVKPKSEFMPEGGRVTQTPKMAARGRVEVDLDPGVYNVRIRDRRTGEVYQTGALEVKPGTDTKAKIDGTSKIVTVDPKYRPEGYQTSSAGVRNLGTVAARENPYNLQLSIGGAYTFASIDASVSQNGRKRRGDDVDLSAPSFRVDMRYYLNGPGMEAGNLGNIGNLGNAGNVGDVGVGFWDPFFGLQGALGTRDRARGLRLNLHPGMRTRDTFLNYEFRGALTPYVGARVLNLGQAGYVRAMAGVRVNFFDMEFETDESGGGGQRNRFSRTKVLAGPVGAIEYNLPFFGGDGRGEPAGGLQFSTWVERLPGTSLERTTQPFNFRYRVETDATVAVTFRAGVFLRF